MLPWGRPATKDDFEDREKIVSQILRDIKHNSILLTGPRRFGKSSIMIKVVEDLTKEGCPCFYFEIEGVNHPEEFIQSLIRTIVNCEYTGKKTKLFEILKKIPGIVIDNVEEISISEAKAKLKDKKAENWKHFNIAIKKLIDEIGTNVYIVIDEFPIAISNMDQEIAREFLNWLRALRHENPNLKLLVGGSISLDAVVKRIAGSAVINDFQRITVEGFDEPSSIKIIKKTFSENGLLYDEKLGKKILECLGIPCIPYYLSFMLNEIKDARLIEGKEIDENLIQDVYEKKILNVQARGYFDHFYERLKHVYPDPMQKAAKAILKSIALADFITIDLAYQLYQKYAGDDDSDNFKFLIDELQHDFYIIIIREERILKFHSKIVKDYWRVHHGNF